MMYNENLHEEEQHLIQQIAEQTERGKIGWELTEYNPLSVNGKLYLSHLGKKGNEYLSHPTKPL